MGATDCTMIQQPRSVLHPSDVTCTACTCEGLECGDSSDSTLGNPDRMTLICPAPNPLAAGKEASTTVNVLAGGVGVLSSRRFHDTAGVRHVHLRYGVPRWLPDYRGGNNCERHAVHQR